MKQSVEPNDKLIAQGPPAITLPPTLFLFCFLFVLSSRLMGNMLSRPLDGPVTVSTTTGIIRIKTCTAIIELYR